MNAANRPVLTDLIQRRNVHLPWIDFAPTNPNTNQMDHDFVMGAKNSCFVELYTCGLVVIPLTNQT